MVRIIIKRFLGDGTPRAAGGRCSAPTFLSAEGAGACGAGFFSAAAAACNEIALADTQTSDMIAKHALPRRRRETLFASLLDFAIICRRCSHTPNFGGD
ncbi:hypothetical protein DLM45_04570 [Hyphomicrobium methylovorum]|nr:hypothetical protein [Hyphomicrobium methylovorum]